MVANFVIKAGLMVASTALGMMRKIEGPRVDNRKFAAGQYNVVLPRVWGTGWVAGQYNWGKDLIEVKRRRKTKGGKYSDYSYFGDFDVVLTCHPIEAVRRIKLDGHLAYDMSGAGPVTPFDFGSAGGNIEDYMTIFPGDEDQAVDDVMRADIEAQHGEGATPAYRGYGRIRFRGLPLEKFGNRIPQVEAEVASGTAFPLRQIDDDMPDNWRFTFSKDYSVLLYDSDEEYELIDVGAGALMIHAEADPRMQHSNHIGAGLLSTGEIICPGASAGQIYRYRPGGGSTLIASASVSMRGVWIFLDENDVEHWYASSGHVSGKIMIDGAEYDVGSFAGFDDCFADAFFQDRDLNVWAVCRNVALTEIYLVRLFSSQVYTITGLSGGGSLVPGAAHYRDDTLDQFVVLHGSTFHIVDLETSAVTTESGPSNATREPWINLPAGARTIWLGFSEYSLADLSVVRTVDPGDWGIASPGSYTVYDPVNRALIDGRRRIYYLDRIGDDGVVLETIVQDVIAVGGGNSARFITSALTHEVPFYSVSGGTGKDWLEPILEVFDVDARPHGFKLEFLPRGGAAGATIDSDDFVLGGDGGDDPLFSSDGAGGTDVPSQVVLQFADIDADNQPNAAASPRLAELHGRRKLNLDMRTLGLDKDSAVRLAHRIHRRRMFDAQPQAFGLPASYSKLEPADVHPLNLRGVVKVARLRSMEIRADRQIRMEWLRDDPAVAVLNAAEGAPFDGRTPSVIAYPLLSQGFFLDIPYLSDVDARTPPSIYVGAAPFADGTWPGAVAFQAVDGEYSDEIAAIEASQATTWGYMLDVLPVANPNVWDRGTIVTVKLQTGTLSGCTEGDIDANPRRNQALIGGEIVNFTTATLVAPLTYDISGFKRGRRGTDGACGTHAAGEVFQLLDAVEPVSMGLDEVGTDLSFKAITSGRTTGFPQAMAPFTGASLKPWAPCHLAAVKDPVTGDWTLAWVRRTRIGGAWTSGTPIPLSEASEEYELTVGDGVSSDTKAVISASTYVWDVAEQTADTGAEVMEGDLAWSVAQVSDAVGAGFLAEAAA